MSMEIRLTDAEREALAVFDNRTYSCACRTEVCERVPCRNERDDLTATVERIKAVAYVAGAAEVLARVREWSEDFFGCNIETCDCADALGLRAALAEDGDA